MPSLNWLINRLRCMSVAEVGHRVQVSAYQHLEKRGWAGLGPVPALETEFADRALLWPVSVSNAADYVQKADRICQGYIDILAKKDVPVGTEPKWTHNALSGQRAPMVYGKTLDYRNPQVLGDIKYIWVPNRHLHWVSVAQAYYLTQNEQYLDYLRQQIDSWLTQNPYLLGPNWISSLELSLRLINWSFVWQLIGGQGSRLFAGEQGQQLKRRWCESVYQQAHFIQGHYSRHSSANNHLIGELAGVCVAAYNWPLHPDMQRWQAAAQAELEVETQAQNYADGVNKEQSTFYQHFVLDFLLITGLFARRVGCDFSSDYWQSITQLTQFLADIMTANGLMPAIGDCDDGVVVKLDCDHPFSVYRSQMATVAVLAEHGKLKRRAGYWDGKSHWLMGDAGAEAFDALAAAEDATPAQNAYPEGGYYLLGSRLGERDEVRCLVDCGGLGYPSIAAHGHADALAFQLFAAGQAIFVDPGTYAYQSEPVWRNYFRGTAAHNTLEVAGCNQSVIGGKFMWLTHAHAECERFEYTPDEQRFEGWHDGYQRLKNGARHRRAILHQSQARCFTFEDSLECQHVHSVALHFHLHPDCEVSLDGNVLTVGRDLFQARLEGDWSGFEVSLVSGQEAPILGWYSPSFSNKQASATLRIAGALAPGQKITSRLSYALKQSGN